ncbi:MAG: NAD(P)H-hydrate epimerase [Candidatus Omnitrophota bacterium]
MRSLTAFQMQEIDKAAVKVLGVPAIILMENAGRGAAEEILSTAGKKKGLKVFIVCGPGNNGGDGFVVARHLLIHGIKPRVFSLVKSLKGDAAVNAAILERMKLSINFRQPTRQELKHADILVDAIFGIGLNREVVGEFANLINDINAYARNVISLDVPSGLDATTGEIHGVCIRAKRTVTFHRVKSGMVRRNGRLHTGKIIVKQIGIV